jgi:hypothetical protein
MTTKGKRILSDHEKVDIFEDILEILRCGDKATVNAFAAKVEAIAKVATVKKKKEQS